MHFSKPGTDFAILISRRRDERGILFQRMDARKSGGYGREEGVMYWLICILAFVGGLYAFLAVVIGRILKEETDELFE